MKNILLALAFTSFALGAYTPTCFAESGIPSAPFGEERLPTAEELAEGTPLSVILTQIKAIQADAAAVKTNPKSTEKLDAIWVTMTPAMKKDCTESGPTAIRRQGFYRGPKNANLDTKTMKFNVTLSEAGYIIIGLSYKKLPTGGGSETYVMKKTDKGWLNCTLNEVPDELVAKTKYHK